MADLVLSCLHFDWTQLSDFSAFRMTSAGKKTPFLLKLLAIVTDRLEIGFYGCARITVIVGYSSLLFIFYCVLLDHSWSSRDRSLFCAASSLLPSYIFEAFPNCRRFVSFLFITIHAIKILTRISVTRCWANFREPLSTLALLLQLSPLTMAFLALRLNFRLFLLPFLLQQVLFWIFKFEICFNEIYLDSCALICRVHGCGGYYEQFSRYLLSHCQFVGSDGCKRSLLKLAMWISQSF